MMCGEVASWASPSAGTVPQTSVKPWLDLEFRVSFLGFRALRTATPDHRVFTFICPSGVWRGFHEGLLVQL